MGGWGLRERWSWPECYNFSFCPKFELKVARINLFKLCIYGGGGGLLGTGKFIWVDHMTLNPEFQVIWMLYE